MRRKFFYKPIQKNTLSRKLLAKSQQRPFHSVSIPKFEKDALCEDAAIATSRMLAVSDGAGGGGVYAERWSAYLLECLPTKPIMSFEALDAWVNGIWERFYKRCETDVKQRNALFQQKFYEEGAFATLAAAWRTDEDTWQWMAYGDSVVFCYDIANNILHHSFTCLTDFNNPPYLVSLNDELQPAGFHAGCFKCQRPYIIFAATDTLAHYILTMYEVSRKEDFADDLTAATHSLSKNSTFVKNAYALPSIDFYHVIKKLCKSYIKKDFKSLMASLLNKRLIGVDDYSLVSYRKR